jgi:hypothetical protein
VLELKGLWVQQVHGVKNGILRTVELYIVQIMLLRRINKPSRRNSHLANRTGNKVSIIAVIKSSMTGLTFLQVTKTYNACVKRIIYTAFFPKSQRMFLILKIIETSFFMLV